MEYIHYGHKKFDIKEFERITNRNAPPKPKGGFWASRLNTTFGWKDFCLREDIKFDFNNFIIFSLKDNAKVITIDKCEQLIKLPQINNKSWRKVWTNLDYEALSKEYDAIEVLISKDNKLRFELFGWDCDSIVIMNPNIIIPKY